MLRPRLLLPCVAVLGSVVLASCGSTVQTTGRGDVAGEVAAPSDGLALESAEPAPGSSGTGTGTGAVGEAPGTGFGGTSDSTGGSATGGSSVSGGGTTGGGTGTGTGSSTSGSGGASGGRVRIGPGVDAKTIKVGVTYTTNGEAGNSAIGGAGISRSDEKANAEAVIAEVNAKGGVAGRRVVPVFAPYDATASEPPGAQDQRACDRLTKDDKVVAVFSSGLTDVFPACMQKAGVAILTSGRLIDQDLTELRRFPALIQLGTLVQERMMRELARSLQRQKWFTGWNFATGSPSPSTPVKVGVITLDSPEWLRPLESTLLPGLKAAGHPVAAENVQRVPFATTTGDAGAQASATSSAILRLRSEQVSHVIILDASATATIFFAQGAKNQGYYPRLGVNSANGMQALTEAGVGGNEVFEGALGLGWFANLDLPAADAKARQGPAARACLEVIKRRTGQDLSTGNGASLALIACDNINFFKAVADRARHLDQSGLIASAESLGTSFTTALYGPTRLGPDRHDALEVGYDMSWDTECTCARYGRSGVIP